MNYVYYDAGAKKVQISNTEVSDAGDYIGEIADTFDPRSPYARFIVGSLLKNAGHSMHLTGLTISAYVPTASENQEQ